AEVATSNARCCTPRHPSWLVPGLGSRPSRSSCRPCNRAGVSVENNESGGLKSGFDGLLLASPTNSGAYGAPRLPPVARLGAQNTGSPMHLISHTYEAMLRWL